MKSTPPNPGLQSIVVGMLTALVMSSCAASASPLGDRWVTGDFTGDGTRDVVVVDSESGLIRLGIGLVDGGIAWGDVFPTGLPGVMSMTANRFDRPTQDSLVLVSPSENRIVHWAWTGPVPSSPAIRSIPTDGLGPGLTAAGAASTPPQLSVISQLNDGPATDRLHLWRFQGGQFAAEYSGAFGNGVFALARAELGPAGARNVLLRAESVVGLEVYSFSSPGTILARTVIPGVTRDGRLLAIARGDGSADLVAYVPGGAEAVRVRLTVVGVNATLSSATRLTLGASAADIRVLQEGESWTIAAVEQGDRRISIHRFREDAPGGPRLEREAAIDASSSDSLLGLIPGPAGQLQVLAGDPGGRRIRRSIRYVRDGAGYREADRRSLPSITPWTAGANLLLLPSPPFVTEATLPLARQRAGDWTRAVTLGAGGGSVVKEVFADSSAGLTHPASQSISVPPGVGGGLVNQYRPNVSVFTWLPVSDDPLPEVNATPGSGTYEAGLTVQLVSVPGNVREPGQIWFRANAGTWQPYGTTIGPLSENTTLDFQWRRARDGARGSLGQATYAVRGSGSAPDCDRDGVPDVVERSRGLDPCSGADSDSDGASDLAELLNGTNPGNRLDKPPVGALRPDPNPTVNIAVEPHSHGGGDGLPPVLFPSLPTQVEAIPATYATLVWLLDLFGRVPSGVTPTALGGDADAMPHAETRVPAFPLGSDPAALFTARRGGWASPILTAHAEDRFDLRRDDGSVASGRGRELLSLVDPAASWAEPFVFTPESGSDAAEASRWLVEATAYYRAHSAPTQLVRLDYLSTLEVLLLEYSVGRLLRERGVIPVSRLTLTPFREEETLADESLGPVPVTAFIPFRRDLLVALEQPPADGGSAYSIVAMRGRLHEMLATPNDPSDRAMVQLAAEFYRIAALPAEGALASLPSPLDALRSFLHDNDNPFGGAAVARALVPAQAPSPQCCQLHEPYLASPAWRLLPAQMQEAREALARLPAVFSPRLPSTWIAVTADTPRPGDCLGWALEGSTEIVTLVDAQSRSVAPPFTFNPPAGSRVRLTGYLHPSPVPGCPGTAVEATRFELLALPSAPSPDINGNGVSDALELYYFGSLIADPNADRDGDGISDLAELRAGSDPLSPVRSRPAIIGRVDMVGETEAAQTVVYANQGPAGANGLSSLPAPFYGGFRIDGLPVSSTVSPAQGYHVGAYLNFRAGRRHEFFRSPELGQGLNPAVTLPDSADADMGDTFVLRPGYLTGRLFLQGPPEAMLGHSSALRGIVRLNEPGADYGSLPANLDSRITISGMNERASGATTTAVFAFAKVSFSGEFDPATSALDGDYEMALAGLSGERSRWYAPTARLLLRNGSAGNPDSYVDHTLIIRELINPQFNTIIEIGMDRRTVDLNFCLSEVTLEVATPSGTLWNPSAEIIGSGFFTEIDGPDFLGNYRWYQAELLDVKGTPVVRGVSSRGRTVVLLPQGSHQIQMTAQVEDPPGVITTRTFPLSVWVGCEEKITAFGDLQIRITGAPMCPSVGPANVTGSVDTPAGVAVARIRWRGDDNVSHVLCENCGEDPSFSFSLPVGGTCDLSRFTVTAEAADGRTVSVSGAIGGTTQSSPCVEIQCPTGIVVDCQAPLGSPVNYSLSATNHCAGLPPTVVCVPPSGTVFRPGITTVNCAASSGPETQRCSFTVTVRCGATPVRAGGRIVDAEGRPATGFQVVASGSSEEIADSDADGFFEFRNLLAGGTYVLTPLRPGHVFTPPVWTFAPLTVDVTANFAVSTPFEQWREAAFVPGTPPNLLAPAADGDGDGKPNALEYVIGTDPGKSDVDPGFKISLAPSNEGAVPLLHLPLNLRLDDAELVLEYAVDPAGPWKSVGIVAADLETGSSRLVWLPNPAERTPFSNPDAFERTAVDWCLRYSAIDDLVDPGKFVRWRVTGVGGAPGAEGGGGGIDGGGGGRDACERALARRKNAALLVGFQNFQRLPLLVRQTLKPEGSPRGYLSDKTAANRLAERIIKGNYDIIALGEVWTEDAKDTLERRLKGLYPYYVKKLDCGGFGAPDELQDSGLMLFSRLPFVGLPGGPRYCDENEAYACGTRSFDVDFIRFGRACSGPIGDCRANKGAGMVQVHDELARRDYVVVFTHLQAFHDDPDQDASRRAQLDLIRRTLLGAYVDAHPPPFPHSTFVLGDFNIDGELAQDNLTDPAGGILQPRNEWYRRLGDRESWWGQQFSDTWEHQSLNDTVPKEWRDRGMTDTSQGSEVNAGAKSRFDYFLTHKGTANRLAVQHMARAFNLQWSPATQGPETPAAFGTAGADLLTDHHGIVAYVHPNVDLDSPGASPSNAVTVLQPESLPVNNAVPVSSELLVAGEFRWFLLPEPGTYSIGVYPQASFTNDVFVTDDLSMLAVDSGSYRTLGFADGVKHLTNRCLIYASPSRPLFVRVRHLDPQGHGRFQLTVRRHQCASREDLCCLPPNAPLFEQSWTTALGSPDRWFLVPTDETTSGRPQNLIVHGEPTGAPDGSGFRFEFYGPDGETLVRSADGVSIPPWTVTDAIDRPVSMRGGDNLWLKVSPMDSGRPRALRLGWSTDLTVVMLNCPSSTGSGADANVLNDLVIGEETDDGISEDEEKLDIEAILSLSAPTIVPRTDPHPGTRFLSAPDTIRTIAPFRLVPDEIDTGQSVGTGRFLRHFGFLPAEHLTVGVLEDDNPCGGACYSYLWGRVESLPRNVFIACGRRTRLIAKENPDEEHYTLRLNLSHGVRWLEFGRSSVGSLFP